MTRMADPERPRDDQEYDDERFEDEGRRSIFSSLCVRAILVLIVLGVFVAVPVPYVLELANQPAPKTTALAKPEMTPAPMPMAPPAPPPVASVPAPAAPAPEKTPAPEKPASGEKSGASESSVPQPMTPAAEKPAPVAPKRSDASKAAVTSKSTASKELAEPRASRATSAPSPTGSGDYFVQVGAFKNPDTAKKLAGRLREQKYNVEETSATATVKSARSAPPSAPPAAGTVSDRYDVHVSGAAPAELNAKLSAKGLSAEPSGGGVVVKPSMPLRDAVALSKDLAVDGLKVQVRRAAGGSAPAPAAANSAPTAMTDDTLYRVRVGPFDDKSTATSTLRELEQKGYQPFIARGGQ